MNHQNDALKAQENPQKKTKRFTLTIPESVHSELVRISAEREISAKDVVIKSLKIGMLAFEAENSKNQELIIRETLDDGTIKEKVILIV